jgi:hypothetical protein
MICKKVNDKMNSDKPDDYFKSRISATINLLLGIGLLCYDFMILRPNLINYIQLFSSFLCFCFGIIFIYFAKLEFRACAVLERTIKIQQIKNVN